MTNSVRNSIAFALTAAVLTGAPMVMAQSVHPSWYSGQSWGDPATGSMSGTTTYYGTAGSSAPMTDMSGSSGSTGGQMDSATSTMGGTSTMMSGRQVLSTVPPADTRRERGQRPTEQMQTSLLNTFSSAGYVTVRDFRKNGERYQAQAQDQYGNWSRVELDPQTGTIARLQ